MADEFVRTAVRGRVAVITLNRPDARNAISLALYDALNGSLRSCESRDDVDAVVLTGVDPAFCAGLDLRDLSVADLSIAALPSEPIVGLTKPLIGAVNGAAVTGGLEVALACDFVVASERARFADTHARVGIMPGWGLTVRLAECIGQRRAREMSLTGNFVDAATALTWGLVNHVVAHDDLLSFAQQLAADVVSNDQAGVREILSIYKAQDERSAGPLRALEGDRSRTWLARGGGSPEEVAQRRSAIVERGRTQQVD